MQAISKKGMEGSVINQGMLNKSPGYICDMLGNLHKDEVEQMLSEAGRYLLEEDPFFNTFRIEGSYWGRPYIDRVVAALRAVKELPL